MAIGVILLATPSFSFFFTNPLGVGQQNGGNNCAWCTIGVGVLEQLTQVHNTSIDKLLDDICGWFPTPIVPICDYFVDKYGSQIIAMVEAKQTGDVICYNLGLCTNHTCQLWPSPPQELPPDFVLPEPKASAPTKTQHKITVLTAENQGVDENPWDWIKDLLARMDKDHQPVEDFDHDNFSDTQTMRGWDWKGRDCNDFDSNFHPGVIPSNKTEIDYNCNGISGFDGAHNVPWHDELCANSKPMGIAVVGDSFGAHFSIPPSYMNASEINSKTYSDLVSCIEDEFDWPERSFSTGFENVTGVMIDSFYLRMRERNRCIHRDYMNVGVNGCRSTTMQSNVIHSLVRQQTTDYPLLLVFELIGNDVCGAHHDLDRMSTVPIFTTAILETLQYLDTVLPNGSHVLFLGLADGRTLWNSLHNRTHPLGVSYETVYTFLNCLEISPCWGWMNENETIRNLTSERAAELSAVYPQIVANYTFKNFDMAYYPFPFDEINKQWIAMGGETWQLIEPIDGFHPNQIAHYLISGYLWNQLETDHPDWLGAINPNNDLIDKLFGDQGGY